MRYVQVGFAIKNVLCVCVCLYVCDSVSLCVVVFTHDLVA